MSFQSFQQRLDSITSNVAQKDKAGAYCSLLGQALDGSAAVLSNVQLVLRSAFDETPVIARQVLSDYLKFLKEKNFDNTLLQSLIRAALELVQPRGVTFDEQVTSGLFVNRVVKPR